MTAAKTLGALLCLAGLQACASYAPANPPAAVRDGVLTGPNGMTLYTFDKDANGSGRSVCNGPCASNWPPLAAAEGDRPDGDYSIVIRDDGSRQWAWRGKPLYFWSKDQKPGERSGDGFNNVWRVARP